MTQLNLNELSQMKSFNQVICVINTFPHIFHYNFLHFLDLRNLCSTCEANHTKTAILLHKKT